MKLNVLRRVSSAVVLCPSLASVAEVEDGSCDGFGRRAVIGTMNVTSAAKAVREKSKLDRIERRILECAMASWTRCLLG